MNDTLGNKLQIGDWVIYGKSNYLRIAKIIEVGTRHNSHYLKLFSAGRDCKVYYREVQLWSPTIWSVLRIENPPLEQQLAINDRLLKEQRKGKFTYVP